MRALLAARAIAAAVVLVPIQAGFEPLAYAIESAADANAPSHATAAQSDQTPQDATLGAFEPAPGARFSGSDLENDPNAVAASVPPDSAGSARMSAEAICAVLDRSASRNDLPLEFFTRLIWQESRFNPFSVSHAGAQGIAQFMPGTAHRVGLVDPFDPIEALPKSAALLRGLRVQFGNLGLAAAAYNAGPKRVEDWLAKRKLLPQETEAYVRIITGRSAQEWTSAEAGAWDVALPAPAPCAQLARPVPHRTQPLIAVHQPVRPAHPIGVQCRCPEEYACRAEERSRTRAPDRLGLRTRPAGGSFPRAPARTARRLAPATGTGPARGSTGVKRAARNRSMQICLMPADGSRMDAKDSRVRAASLAPVSRCNRGNLA